MIADEQFQWFYWLGPILAASFLAMVVALSVAYVRKVLVPKYRGRRVE